MGSYLHIGKQQINSKRLSKLTYDLLLDALPNTKKLHESIKFKLSLSELAITLHYVREFVQSKQYLEEIYTLYAKEYCWKSIEDAQYDFNILCSRLTDELLRVLLEGKHKIKCRWI